MKNIRSVVINRANILLLITVLLVLFLEGQKETASPIAFLIVLALAEVLFLVRYARDRKKSELDIATVTFLILGFWELVVKTGWAHPVLVPAPEDVFMVFYSERELMLQGVGSSLWLLLWSVGLALVLGVFLGLIVGWIPRAREAVVPIANVIGPIPPLVYTPYVVAVMPTFRSASTLVIFMACFFPVFTTMISRVASMDRRIIQSAQVMAVSTPQMLFRVILPYCMPGILGSLPGTMRGAFLCLTGAELLGASSGLGYFVKKFSDYANYTKVIAGIILMGVVVTLIDIALEQIYKRAVKWNYS